MSIEDDITREARPMLRRPPRAPEPLMNSEARLAAARLQDADFADANGVDMFKAASGGYGRARQQELLDDIRSLYSFVLGTRPGRGPATPFSPSTPFGDTAA